MGMNRNPNQIKSTAEGLMALAKIRTSPEWGAVLALKDSFIEKYKGDIFRLDPSAPDLQTEHARIAGKALGIVDFIEYIEESQRKVEDSFIDLVREDQILSIVK